MSPEFPLRKMAVQAGDTIRYAMATPEGNIDLQPYIGRVFTLRATGGLTCVHCGKAVRKFYGQGFCFPCLQKAPEAAECIVRPELCRAHLGEGRDPAWEHDHHATEHVVYLSQTSNRTIKASGMKVGVTRSSQVPVRWIDQGAVAAVVLARTPYRQLAGLIEVDLKAHLSDRTDRYGMLQHVEPDPHDLDRLRSRVAELLDPALHEWLVKEPSNLETLAYPVLVWPSKMQSVQLAKTPEISGTLVGIKGQYLLWEDGRALNVRNHAGYHVMVGE